MKNLKFLFLISAVFSVSLFSCKKDDPCITGTVRFTNTSNNPYDLFVDNEFQLQINGNTFGELDLLEGQRQVRVEQVSGFLLFPTILEESISVFGCQESEWIFP